MGDNPVSIIPSGIDAREVTYKYYCDILNFFTVLYFVAHYCKVNTGIF